MKAGWKLTTLGDSFTTATGNTPPKNNAGLFGSFMPLVKPPELCDAELDTSEDGLSELGVPFARTVPPNSILVSCIGNLGKIGLNTVPVAFNQQINAILPDARKALPRFMFFQVLSCTFKDQLESMASGTTVPIVNKSKFNSIQIVLPPLSEQKRIVTLLDEVFAHIATAKANAEQNLQNARALFESHLQSVFSRRNKGWLNKPLGDCVNAISTGPFGSLLHKSDYVFGGTPLVNPINIAGEEIVSNPNKTVSTETVDRLHAYKLRENDIVIARRGEIGRCAVVQKDQSGWLCGTGCFIIRPSKSTDPHYLTHLLRSAHYRKQLEGVSDRATMPSISNSDLSSLVVVLPPITEQLNFLERIKLLSTETQRLESIYQQKLTALDALKKSLLHQAFCGQL